MTVESKAKGAYLFPLVPVCDSVSTIPTYSSVNPWNKSLVVQMNDIICFFGGEAILMGFALLFCGAPAGSLVELTGAIGSTV